MTYLSSDLIDGRYRVLEFPRGPRIGTVRCVGTRQWLAACATCDWTDEGGTRPAAAARLGRHHMRHLR